MMKLVLLVLFSMLCLAQPSLTNEEIITESILYYENSPATFICNGTYAIWKIDNTNITECNCPGKCEDIVFDETRLTAYCDGSSPVLHFKQMNIADNFKTLKCFNESSWNFRLLVGRQSDYFTAEEPFALINNNYTLVCEKSPHEDIYLYDDTKEIGRIFYNYDIFNNDEDNVAIIGGQWNVTLTIKTVALKDDGKIFGCFTYPNGLSLFNLTVNVSSHLTNTTITASNEKILYYENSSATFICNNTYAIWMLNDNVITECTCPGKCGDVRFDKTRLTAYCNGSSPVLHFKRMKLDDNFKGLKCSDKNLWNFTLLVGKRNNDFYPKEPFALVGNNYALVCEKGTYDDVYLYDEKKAIGSISSYSYYYAENFDGETFDITSDQWNVTLTIKKVALKDDGKIFGCYLRGKHLSLLNLTVNVPVSFVLLRYQTPLIEDENEIFICKVYQSKPKASFQWILSENGSKREITQNTNITSELNGKLWQTTSTLKLKLKRSFQAIRCQARIHKMAWKSSVYEILDISVPVSSVSLQQTTGLIIEDANIIFVCKVDESKPTASIEWILSEYGFERQITNNSYIIPPEQNGKLYETTSILNLKLKRSFKTIRCRARIHGMSWTNSKSLPLDVKYPPPGMPVITVNNSEICVGEEIIITCDWQDGYPRASVNLTCLSKSETNEDSVTITETVTRKMSNYCQCEGNYMAEKMVSTYDMSIQFPLSSVSLHQETTNILIEDENETFVCKVDESKPNASFQWILSENGSEREITENIDITSEQNGKLWQTNSTLKLKLKRTFQTIKCRAKLQEMCWTNSTSLLLDVKYPPPGKPVITVNNPKICVGEQIIITCEWRGGHPSASLTLTCLSVTKTNEDYIIITEPVTNTMSNNCRCEGKQINKNAFTTYDISIHYPPNQVKINQTSLKGNVSSFLCDASGGYPAAYKYSWSPGNYPAEKQINVNLKKVSIRELTCTVTHKCAGDISATIRLFDEDVSIWLIVVPTLAALIIIISAGIICFKYRSYSMKKKAANTIPPLPDRPNLGHETENTYQDVEIQQEEDETENTYQDVETQQKENERQKNLYVDMQLKVPENEATKPIYENLKMLRKDVNEEVIYDDLQSLERADDQTNKNL